ncbi:hypothetical protein [Bacillus cereus]|nr:hypothetical protein [Bacillus cereus]
MNLFIGVQLIMKMRKLVFQMDANGHIVQLMKEYFLIIHLL